MSFFDRRGIERKLEGLHLEYREKIIPLEEAVQPQRPVMPLLKGWEYREVLATYQDYRKRVMETIWEALRLLMEDSSVVWQRSEARLPSQVFRMEGEEFTTVIHANYRIEVSYLTSRTVGEKNIYVRIICLRAKWPPFPSIYLHAMQGRAGKFLPTKALEVFCWRERDEIQTEISSACKHLKEKWGE